MPSHDSIKYEDQLDESSIEKEIINIESKEQFPLADSKDEICQDIKKEIEGKASKLDSNKTIKI